MNIDIVDNKVTAIHTYLKRTKHGIKVDVIVVPEVEEFFKHWGTGQQVNAVANGRSWKTFPPQPDGEKPAPIYAWAINSLRDESIGQFDLYSLGRSLASPTERGQNISFIRLVGASSGASFLYEDVVSYDGLLAMGERIRNATQRFYDQFIRPVHIDVEVSSRVRTVSQQE